MSRHRIVMVASHVEAFNIGQRTNVLLGCECGCGKATVKTLNGAWLPSALQKVFPTTSPEVTKVTGDV